MDKELEIFKTNVDAWIRQIRSEYSTILDLDLKLVENTDNIQHNYELVHELREEVEELRKELSLLKMLQVMSLKPEIREEIKKRYL